MAEDSASASTSFEAKVVDAEAKIQCVVCFDEISQHQAISCPINNPSCSGHTCYTCTIRSIDSDDRLTRRCFSCQCEVTLDDLSKKLGFTKLTLRDNTIRVTKIIMREYQPGRVQIIPIEQPAGDQRIPILAAAEARVWPRLQPQPNAVPYQRLADEIIQQQNMAAQAQRAAIVPPQDDEQAQNPLEGQVQALWLPAHPNHLALPGEQAPPPQQADQAQPPQNVEFPPQQAQPPQDVQNPPQQAERAQLIRIGQFRALLLPGRPGQGPALLIPGNLALPGEQVPPPQQAQLPQDVRVPPQQAEQAQPLRNEQIPLQQAEQAQFLQDVGFPPQQAEQAQPLRDERAQPVQPQPIRKRAQPHQPEQDPVSFRQPPPPPVQRPVYPTCSKCEKNNHAIIPCMNIFCDQIVCCVCFREILPQAAQTGPGSPMTCTKCLRSYSCREWAQHADRRIPTFERLIYS